MRPLQKFWFLSHLFLWIPYTPLLFSESHGFFKGIICMSWMASFLGETFRVGYRMIGSLLGNSVMVQFKLHLLLLPLFFYLFRVFIFLGCGTTSFFFFFNYFTLFETLRMVSNETYLATRRVRERVKNM